MRHFIGLDPVCQLSSLDGSVGLMLRLLWHHRNNLSTDVNGVVSRISCVIATL